MMAKKTTSAAMRKPKDPEGSRADILVAATLEFASRGFGGARVDAIARQTRITRAMIYYYYRSKEGLYLAVLERAYLGIREAEKQLDLAHLPPEQALRQLVGFTFDYYHAHPEFVALVVAENQAGGRHIRKMRKMKRQNVTAVQSIKEVLERGRRDGVFRDGFDAIDLHMTIAALGWFQIANRHTFGYLFQRDFAVPSTIARHRELVIDVVMQFVTGPGTSGTGDWRNGRGGRISGPADIEQPDARIRAFGNRASG